jgi:GxxExxY protein
VQAQAALPINYRELKLDAADRMDLVVEDLVIVEVKAMNG